ncbi:MAG TPA: hypothetical protein VNO26_17200 [Candidatus Limnocylindria bacterium]|nr:hypothetical protein [Candidatus Limnocylindria bacterium]
MQWRTTMVRILAVGAVCVLALRAVSVRSVGGVPEVVRVTVQNNDLAAVDGLAPPGSSVELWYRQRNFREGNGTGFSWCGWKNGGEPVQLGTATANDDGRWRLANLHLVSSVMMFPGVATGGGCAGGVYTELLPRICSAGVCTPWTTPVVHWLDVRRRDGQGQAGASISGALHTALAAADGPNDGSEPSSVYDVDEDGIDTTLPGFSPGQRVTWKCGSGGTAICPSVTIHDASTVIQPDPEFPFILATLQGHAPGGSVFAAAAIDRNQDLGFAVNVNVRVKADLDVDLGCEQGTFFDFWSPS